MVRRPRFGVRGRVRAAFLTIADFRHWFALRRLARDSPSDYRAYLDLQLRRSLSKRRNDPGVGARILIERLVEEHPSANAAVLCVGCRNDVELDEFRARGFASVVGIDLFSQRPDIVVMDMHEMSFEDDSFDIIYASHSLEHSYDLARVAGELVRVARDGALLAVEVPLRVRASAADRIEFPGVAALQDLFRAHVSEELLVEEQPPRTERNSQGTDIGRLVLRVAKKPAFVA